MLAFLDSSAKFPCSLCPCSSLSTFLPQARFLLCNPVFLFPHQPLLRNCFSPGFSFFFPSNIWMLEPQVSIVGSSFAPRDLILFSRFLYRINHHKYNLLAENLPVISLTLTSVSCRYFNTCHHGSEQKILNLKYLWQNSWYISCISLLALT